MTSPIAPVGALGPVSPVAPLSGATGTEAVSGPNADFASKLADGLQNVQDLQTKAEDLAVKAADGTLTDPAQYTMASTEASLALQLTMAVRNKAVEAFQEIMRLQA
jgi:flagellar hook-basal body complex protein FliE